MGLTAIGVTVAMCWYGRLFQKRIDSVKSLDSVEIDSIQELNFFYRKKAIVGTWVLLSLGILINMVGLCYFVLEVRGAFLLNIFGCFLILVGIISLYSMAKTKGKLAGGTFTFKSPLRSISFEMDEVILVNHVQGFIDVYLTNKRWKRLPAELENMPIFFKILERRSDQNSSKIKNIFDHLKK